MAKQKDNPGEKTITTNRRARHDYFIDDTWEAGLVLKGTEVKSLREGKATITEAYVRLDKSGEAFLVGCAIQPWSAGNRYNHELTRPRKLLMHKRELRRLIGKVNREGYTLIPMRLYFNGGKAKLEVGLGKGKKQHDKRADTKKADAKRAMDRAKRKYR
ncbi:MAG: SsrA-binding protein SmpB [Deltaproteobacteria bacterium]|nr:SsrA-binding protein SmpB [Deltaproteobacteria bacterium]